MVVYHIERDGKIGIISECRDACIIKLQCPFTEVLEGMNKSYLQYELFLLYFKTWKNENKL